MLCRFHPKTSSRTKMPLPESVSASKSRRVENVALRFRTARLLRCFLRFSALALLVMLLSGEAAAIVAPPESPLVISEFRLRGPNGANDEFIEIYNISGADHTVTAASGTGYGIAASDGITRCSIPNGTVIPTGGHYLCVNSVGYSLASYPAGNGTTATGDATYTTDISDNAGIALFNNNTGGGSYSVANRLDAIGSTSEANTLYKEGTGYPALTPFSIDYSWVRDACGKGGAVNLLTPCTENGLPKDTDSNSADFFFVDTNGTSAGGGQRLGAPGPENLSSPVSNTSSSSSIPNAPLDTCVADFSAPNFVRDFTSDPANNSTFGTIDIRRTFTNDTGAPLTRLRFRIVDLDTFPAASGFADLRPRTATSVVVTVDRPPCGSGTSNVIVQGTTLEQPPSQPNGGGFNSSMGAGTVTLGTPLVNGASIDLRFLFGIQQTGNFRVAIVIEGLPGGGAPADFLFLRCHTDSGCPAPVVSSIARADPDPTSAASVNFTVTFDQPVTGVDATDFVVTTTGTIMGATVTNVTGSDATRTVTVSTGTGEGTIRLDVVDDDTINNAGLLLGGPGAGNGDFNTGEAYTVGQPPAVLSVVRVNPDPTSAASVDFTVTFSESVTGVDTADFSLTTTGAISGAAITGVTGSGATYTVTVDTGTGQGTIRLDVIDDDSIVDSATTPLGGAGTGNGNFTSGQVYSIIQPPSPPSVVSITRLNPNPNSLTSVDFLVTFSESVTGVDTADFSLTTTGAISGVAITGIAGTGDTYTVTVDTGTGQGTIRLDVIDDDSIVDSATTPLGGAGTGNGNFTAGEVYTISAVSGPVAVPAMDSGLLMLLALALASISLIAMRRNAPES